MPDFTFEDECGAAPVAGIDEAGRGPWAGPVVAAAVVLDRDRVPPGLADSKTLSAAARARLHAAIRHCAAVGIGMATVEEIDRLNIREATFLAMARALEALPVRPAFALVDGNGMPRLSCPAQCVVKGDARSLSIAAASIIAKVERDRLMDELGADHPGYGWERNRGYGTAEHAAALASLGITPHHRRSFRPIHNILCMPDSRESR
jgi:ribonuclease HII